MEKPKMKWVIVAECSDEFEAKIILGKLILEGLEAKSDNDSLGAIYPGTILAGPIKVYVKEEDLVTAREILD